MDKKQGTGRDEDRSTSSIAGEESVGQSQAGTEGDASAGKSHEGLQGDASAGKSHEGLEGDASAGKSHEGLEGDASAERSQARAQDDASAGMSHEGLQGDASAGKSHEGLQGDASAERPEVGGQDDTSAGKSREGLQGDASAGKSHEGLQGDASAGKSHEGLQGDASAERSQAGAQGDASAGRSQAESAEDMSKEKSASETRHEKSTGKIGLTTLEKAIALVTRATEEDNNRNYVEALRLYEHALDHFIHSIKYEVQSQKAKDSIRAQCSQYLERAEKLRTFCREKKLLTTSARGRNRSDSSDDDTDDAKEIKDAIVRNVTHGSTLWANVAGLYEAKNSLEQAVLFPLKFPHLFTGVRTSCTGVLLIGPPGAGKTLLMKALAARVSDVHVASFYVSSADVEYRWRDRNDKLVALIQTAFNKAQRKNPSLLFLDDVDALCSVTSPQQVKSELVTQLQGEGTGVTLVGATRAPWNIDRVVMKRFEERIFVPLPDADARRVIFRTALNDTPHYLSESALIQIGHQTNGYSGSDINAVVQEASRMPLRNVQTATHFRKVRGPSVRDRNMIDNDTLTPCSPGAPGAMMMDWTEVPGDKLVAPLVTERDVMIALHQTKLTSNKEDLEKLKDFCL